MAHLVVCRETIISQENMSTSNRDSSLSIGKHPRASEAKQFGAIGTESKRRALGSITNIILPHQSSGYEHNVGDHNKLALQAHIQTHCEPTSSFTGLIQPIGTFSSSVLSHDTQGRKISIGSSNSFPLSNSLLSFGSPGSFGSPMIMSPSFAQSQEEVINVDQLDDCYHMAVGEYTKDIFAYLKEAEIRFKPNADYFTKQPDITQGMRCILVDWLVEVCDEFKLEQQTLYLGMALVDRFLSVMSVLRSKLQLVGASSMFLAAKFEEIYPPEVGDFVYITDDTYTKLQIARMEAMILKALDFNLLCPTIHTFLLRYLRVSEVEGGQLVGRILTTAQQCSALSKYLCELALLNGDLYLKYQPSVIAASSLCLARHTLQQQAWTKSLQYYSGYSVSDMSSCVADLQRTLAMAPAHPQQAIRNKYNCDKYLKVSTLKAPETLPC